MVTTAVIMAGGKGERFWPKSREKLPKQFLSLTSDGKTMIQKTVERLDGIVAKEDIFVITNNSYISIVKQQLEGIPEENIIGEPAARNTAPCIGLAAAVIEKKYGEAIMAVLPSDHLINNNDLYIDTLEKGIKAALLGDNLITIGITPNYPETGYGYIKYEYKNPHENGIFSVDKFVEKPTLELAAQYVNAGNYLWNSGMFIWKTSSVMSKFKEFIPEYTVGLEQIKEAYGSNLFNTVLNEVFPHFKSESIDYGIMEKSENIFTIPGNFGWDDVGSWLALERINTANEDNNVIQGDIISINSKNNIIIGSDKLIAAVGVDNLIVIQTEDAFLICSKNDTQSIKKVVETLKYNNRNDLL